MCLSNVYKDERKDDNLIAKNVADIKFESDGIYFTDIMGVRTAFEGRVERIDLTDNYIIVKK